MEIFEIGGLGWHFISLVVGYIIGVLITYSTANLLFLDDDPNHNEK